MKFKGSIFLALSLSTLVGCQKEAFVPLLLDYPELSFSTQELEFGEVDDGETESRIFSIQNDGELPMGVSAIYLGSGHDTSFSISYDLLAMKCPVVEDSSTGATGTTGDTSGTTGDTGMVNDELFIMAPGCKLPVEVSFAPDVVGEVHGSVIIETEGQVVEEGEPAYFADLDRTRAIVYLQGVGLRGEGNAIVDPRFLDFGHVWTGEEARDLVEVSNAGDGVLTLSAPVFSEICDEGFHVDWAYEDGLELLPGTSSVVELSFTPVDQSSAFCNMTIGSDDADNGEIVVTMQGNTGVDPNNEAPTIELIRPLPGTQHNSADPLVVELKIFDVNQPADSLLCKVKSMHLMEGVSVANCTAPDESGHVVVDLDVNDIPSGVDTLLISVTDASEVITTASVPVLIRGSFPSSDDDGDGFGDADSGDRWDCDDSDPTVYPKAAELIDGIDNDCDSLIDEGTYGFDDDGDTFSEADGDCNDRDASSFPGAPELPDHADNNCNGIVDEGTSLYDDDGDGYSEVNNDCDDSDPEINPGALEVCDGIDNDCNGLQGSNDDCVELSTAPLIVGGVAMDRTAVEEGESLELSMYVYDADGQDISWSWSVGSEGGEIDDTTAAVVNWTAPELPNGSDGQLYSVYVVVQDEDGNQAWEFEEIAVYPHNKLNGEKFVRLVENEDTSLCSSVSSTRGSFMAGLLALGALMVRRRGHKE